MFSPLALAKLHSLSSLHAGLIPAACGSIMGLAAIFRGTLANLHLFGPRESQSIMNFSPLGTLRCICGEEHEGPAERRHFCRSCGCEVVATNPALLYKELTRAEIRSMTKSLRQAAIRAENLELPSTVTSVGELHRYLRTPERKESRTPPRPPSAMEQTQVH